MAQPALPPELNRPNWNWSPGGRASFIQVLLGIVGIVLSIAAIFASARGGEDLRWLANNVFLIVVAAVVVPLVVMPAVTWAVEAAPIFFQRIRRYPTLARQYRDLDDARLASIAFVELDDSLLRLLAELSNATDKTSAMQNLLIAFLRDSTRIFGGDVSRGSILRSVPESDYLERWAFIDMPAETTRDTPYYIGDTKGIRRGVAGWAFKTGRVYVVHMENKNGYRVPVVHVVNDEKQLVPDTVNDYIESDIRRPYPPYRAFICIPIEQGTDEQGHHLPPRGVLCFDSMNIEVFDSQNTHEALLILARRIAAAAKVYDNLTN